MPLDGQGTEAAKELYVVGIGASSRGLEAPKVFVANLQPSSFLVYVIAQHLSPLTLDGGSCRRSMAW